MFEISYRYETDPSFRKLCQSYASSNTGKCYLITDFYKGECISDDVFKKFINP